MAKHKQIPRYHQLMNPLLAAMHELGGSGSIDEISEKVTESLDLPEDVLAIPHDPEKSSMTEIEYQLAWARTYLKNYGILDNSSRGVWVIVPDKRDVTDIDPQEVVRTAREKSKKEREAVPLVPKSEEELPDGNESWRTKLHHVLTRELSPDAFERLVKRMLRESGFVQVEVTGRSGDGGIDGKGIVKVGGLLSFHVLFQCKKYKGSVSAGAIRDFRGALVGRADKGLFVSTGTFTRDAMREATRDGAPPIDLIDGDQLADKLKELRLGIKAEMVESVDVDEDWFKNI
ncbi:MAG: restriction endonuclease [candidate division Zixibacteria bacterium]|jgi:restriction system protein|nr:restriction endonuclease [candidate division Zixibacteria bacterium]